MANSNPTREIESLAAEIGDQIYIDVANWHLYLSDAHLHTTVAERVYPLLEKKNFNEQQVKSILQQISVPLGGGRTQLPLINLIPQNTIQDLMKILEDYEKQL